MPGGTAELALPQRYRLGLGTAASVRPETAGVKQSVNNMFLDKYRTSESQSLAQNIINKTFNKSKKQRNKSKNMNKNKPFQTRFINIDQDTYQDIQGTK